jgi:hypothetical protein
VGGERGALIGVNPGRRCASAAGLGRNAMVALGGRWTYDNKRSYRFGRVMFGLRNRMAGRVFLRMTVGCGDPCGSPTLD